MSIKTIYTCDKCGNAQDSEKQFWNVGVTAKTIDQVLTSFFVTGKSMQVCRPCLESFGIHVQKKPETEKQPEPPTLEDMIRDIVAEATAEF